MPLTGSRVLRRVSHALIPEKIANRRRNKLRSGIHGIQVPLRPDAVRGWKPYPKFKGNTRNCDFLSCHVSVLTHGSCPHPPHTHEDEEILLLLAGEVDLILPVNEELGGNRRMRLQAGEFVYYPAFHPHTLETVSDQPANYLMLKWRAQNQVIGEPISFGRFNTSRPETGRSKKSGFYTKRLFQGSTNHLRKLQCHVTALEPGGGYEVHVDAHDVAIVMLDGECETLGRRFGPDSVVFYPAGEPHGMRNPGNRTAHYVVFEFHGDYIPSRLTRLKARFLS